jgi:hypothetical protein
MDVNKRSVEQIFDPTAQLEAPLFQRPYVWRQQKNWQPLWESIQDLAEKRVEGGNVRPHFLGTIVLDQLPTPTGSITKRQIIDGQQRLTTLQLALAAVRDICQAAGEGGSIKAAAYQDAFAKLTRNHIPLSDDPDEIFKIYPTNADRAHFRAVMGADTHETAHQLIAAGGDSEALIPRAYLFFHETISSWLATQDEEGFIKRVAALYQAVKGDLSLIVIDLDEKDDAQVIFETLNALGTPLLPADLVKNFLFHFAEHQEEDTIKLYDKYWLPFDADSGYWRKEVRQGRLNRPRLDLFLQHYLTLVIGEEAVATQLFSTFREYVWKSGESASTHLARLREYADVYRSFETFPAHSPEGTFFYRLEQLDTTTVYPLLLEVVKRRNASHHRAELLQIFKDLEAFLVRRTVCQLTPKNYNRFFADMVKKLQEGDDFSASAIRQILLEQTADTSRFPDDEEFHHAWCSVEVYKRLVRRRLRMILEALNSEMHTEKTEQVYIKEKLTIEHLMPQEWETHWELPEGVTPEQRDHLLQTIGNLTLLTKKLNPAISNSAWGIKRPEILKHSVLQMNNQFYDAEEWNEAAIQQRTEQLFSWAVKLWSRSPE